LAVFVDIGPYSERSSCFRGQYRSRNWQAIRVFSDTSLGRPLGLELRDDPFRRLDIAARYLVVSVDQAGETAQYATVQATSSWLRRTQIVGGTVFGGWVTERRPQTFMIRVSWAVESKLKE
jgi:hypothetical protein